MTSTEKVWGLLEHLQDSEDDELAEAFPISLPPTILRGALVMAGDQLPHSPEELDSFLASVSEFCLALRSDEPASVALEAAE